MIRTHDAQAQAPSRITIRPPVHPKEGHVFGLAKPIKLRDGGTIADLLADTRGRY